MADQYYKQVVKALVRRFLPNNDVAEARGLVESLGAKAEFDRLLPAVNSDPYRISQDLAEVVITAIEKRREDPAAIANLEERVKSSRSAQVTGLDIAKEYISAYTIGIAKGVYTTVAETLKAVILSMLPGRMQTWIEKKAAEKGGRRALYNTLSVVYDTAAVGVGYFMLVPTFRFQAGYYLLGVGSTAITGFASGMTRAFLYPDHDSPFRQSGTLGPLLGELVLYPLKKLGEGFSHFNEQARKNLEGKKRLLLKEHKED